MSTKQFRLMLVVTVSAGIVGGMLSSLLLNVELVAAQNVLKRPKVIEAQSFHVVDQEGKVRAILEAAPDGAVGLVMGKEGIIRVRLVLNTDGSAGLDLTDEKGRSHATLGVSSAGSPSLSIYDKASLSAAFLGEANFPISNAGVTEERPAGSLVLLNKEGKIVWRAP